MGSAKLKLGEPTFGMSTLVPKQAKENSAILVEESEPSGSKAKSKDLRPRSLNKNMLNNTMNSRKNKKMLLLSGTKQAKMMERTSDNKYNHNAYYNPETNHKSSAKRPKIGINKTNPDKS